jgi:hypothetical protein
MEPLNDLAASIKKYGGFLMGEKTVKSIGRRLPELCNKKPGFIERVVA